MSEKMKKRKKITIILLSAILAASTLLFVRSYSAQHPTSAESASYEKAVYYEI